MKNIKTISGLEEIYHKYEVFILDQWGVMHNGEKGYKHSIHCVDKLHSNKKILTIISNSSKRKESTIACLPDLGFRKNLFKLVMTSGEMIWQSLFNQNYEETRKLNKNFFYIYDETKEDGKNYIKGLEKYNIVDNIEEADFILGCTPFANFEVLDYVPILSSAKKNNIPFICANPDFDTVESNSNKLIFCLGTIAELYKSLGGKVFYLGKPSIEIYNETLNRIKFFDKRKILAIGDSLHHDIKGAMNLGIDSLLITGTGIHKDLFDINTPKWDRKNKKLNKFGIEPTYICKDFNF